MIIKASNYVQIICIKIFEIVLLLVEQNFESCTLSIMKLDMYFTKSLNKNNLTKSKKSSHLPKELQHAHSKIKKVKNPPSPGCTLIEFT